MKRLILMLLTMTVLLCGCSEKPIADPQVPEAGYDNSGARIVLLTGERLIPISYAVDGASQIEPGIYWYYELENCLENSSGGQFQTYNVKNQKPAAERTFEKLKNKKSYAVNGAWPLFCELNHKSYSDKDQDRLSEHIITALIKVLEGNDLDQEKLTVNDVWGCDFDADGTNEVFLSATCGAEGQSVLGYVKGDSCQLINVGRGAEQAEVTPLVMDLNGTGAWSLVLLREGTYDEFMVYDYKDGNFALKYQIIF